jgi:hypothetical protein
LQNEASEAYLSSSWAFEKREREGGKLCERRGRKRGKHDQRVTGATERELQDLGTDSVWERNTTNISERTNDERTDRNGKKKINQLCPPPLPSLLIILAHLIRLHSVILSEPPLDVKDPDVEVGFERLERREGEVEGGVVFARGALSVKLSQRE